MTRERLTDEELREWAEKRTDDAGRLRVNCPLRARSGEAGGGAEAIR